MAVLLDGAIRWKEGVSVGRLDVSEYEEKKELASMTETIKALLMDTVWNFTYAGYYLKQIRDRKLYEIAGFDSVAAYAIENFGFSASVTSRYMDMNTKFSVDGNSIEIREEFKRYNKSQMQEMLYLRDDQMEQVSPEMTVKQIREIRNPEEPEKERVEAMFDQMLQRPNDIPGQINVTEWDGGAYIPEDQKIEYSLEQCIYHFYTHLFDEECMKHVQQGSIKASVLKEKFGSCYSGYGGPGYPNISCSPKSVVFEHGMYELSYSQLAKLLEPCFSEQNVSEKLHNPKTVIAVEGCKDRNNCFICTKECDIRQENRWCVEAPCGNPFACTTMNTIEMIKSDLGEECEFINSDKAYKRAGDNQPDPCCQHCTILCGYRCNRASKKNDSTGDEISENVIDAEYKEVEKFEVRIPTKYPDSLSPDEISVLKEKIQEEANIIETMGSYWQQNQSYTLLKHETLLAACNLMLLHKNDIKEDNGVDIYTKEQITDLIRSLTNQEKREKFLSSNALEFWNPLIEVPEINAAFFYMDLPSGSRIIRKNKIHTVHYNSNTYYILQKPDDEFSLEYPVSLNGISDTLKKEKELLKK